MIMTALKPLALAIGATLLVAACAPTSGTSTGTRQANNNSTNQCFFVNNISGFSDVKQNSFVLNIADGRNFNVQTLTNCENLDFAIGMSVTPQFGMDTLCQGDLAYLHTGVFAPESFPCQVQIGSPVASTTAAPSSGH